MSPAAFALGAPLLSHARTQSHAQRQRQQRHVCRVTPRAGLPGLPAPPTSPFAVANVAAGAATKAILPAAVTGSAKAAASAKAAVAVAGAAATADAVVNATGENFGDQGQVARYMAIFVFFCVVLVTVGTVVTTYQSWVLRRNDKDSRAEVAARLSQFGGPDKLEVRDYPFATIKSAKGKGVRKPWLKGMYPGESGVGGLKFKNASGRDGAKRNVATTAPTSPAAGYDGNRLARRRQMQEDRRNKRSAQREAASNKVKIGKSKDIVEETANDK
jgi:hypothetical protein